MCTTWRLMMPVARSAIGSVWFISDNACTAPWIAPSGLRSSCASIARNSSFDRFSRCARQRTDVAQDQRAMFDFVEHDARQRHLDFRRLLAVEHQARLVSRRSMVEHGAEDLA